MLDPEAAVAMAMAIHELLTNAAKYGALSTPSGTVAIAWTYVETPEPGKARLEWKERGGPPVAAPMRRGFGTRFIERVLSGQSRGQAAIRFEQDGVRAVFEATAGLPWSPPPKKNAPG